MRNYNVFLDGNYDCLTVRELKQIIKNWPEKYEDGRDTLVLINWPIKKCGKVTLLTKLDVEENLDDNGEIGGILLSTNDNL